MLSIPERATEIIEQNILQGDGDNSRTIFFVGSKDVGKSTLINTFLNKTDTPRETLVLEYSFGRKSSSKQSIEKIICHIWEYGGKLETLKHTLLSIPLRGTFFYCILLDLNKLKRLWTTIENCVEAMNELNSKTDLKPVPIIIGGKYDLFKNYDTEVKKMVCTTMRCVALLLNAHLIFHSSKEPILLKRTKDMLNYVGFGNGVPFKDKHTNFMKPLFIPKDTDNWESIGISPSTFDEVKNRYRSRIAPDIENVSGIIATTAQKLSHPEPSIDSLINLKYDELRNMETLDISIYEYLHTINK